MAQVFTKENYNRMCELILKAVLQNVVIQGRFQSALYSTGFAA